MALSKEEKRSESQRTQVKVCIVCGHRGFSNALIYCSQCSSTTVHQYCVGIPPVSFGDSYDWVCEYCSAAMWPESFSCQAFSSASIESTPQSCVGHAGEGEIMVIPDQPEPLCVVFPVSCKGNSEHEEIRSYSRVAEEVPRIASTFLPDGDSLYYMEEHLSPASSLECPKLAMWGLVLLVSPSGEIIICRGTRFCDDRDCQKAGDHMRISWNNHSPRYFRESEVHVSSRMECPEAISGELLLLVKSTGEIIILCGVNSLDDPHSPGWEAAVYNIINSSIETNSYKPFRKLAVYKVTPDMFSLGELIDEYGDFTDDYRMEEIGGLNCILSKKTDMRCSDDSAKKIQIGVQGDNAFEYLFDAYVNTQGDIPQSNDAVDVNGSKSQHEMRHKKTTISSSNVYDYIPTLMPECKRARRKRYKISPCKEIDVSTVVVAGLPATASGYKKGTKRKTTVNEYFSACDYIPPLKPECKRARSKRWEVRISRLSTVQDTVGELRQRFNKLRQRFDKVSEAGICTTENSFISDGLHIGVTNEEECTPHVVAEIKESETVMDEACDLVNKLAIINRDEENGHLVDVVGPCNRISRERVCIVNGSLGQDPGTPGSPFIKPEREVATGLLLLQYAAMSLCGIQCARGLTTPVHIASWDSYMGSTAGEGEADPKTALEETVIEEQCSRDTYMELDTLHPRQFSGLTKQVQHADLFREITSEDMDIEGDSETLNACPHPLNAVQCGCKGEHPLVMASNEGIGNGFLHMDQELAKKHTIPCSCYHSNGNERGNGYRNKRCGISLTRASLTPTRSEGCEMDRVSMLQGELFDDGPSHFEEISTPNPMMKLPSHKQFVCDKVAELSKSFYIDDNPKSENLKLVGLNEVQHVDVLVKEKGNQLWLAGYFDALRVVGQLHPKLKLNWDSLVAVGNLMSLQVHGNEE